MPDDADIAQEINEQHFADALAAHYRHLTNGDSATHCDDCGDTIPEKRRQAVRGCKRCVDCQTTFENHYPGRGL